MIRPHNGLKFFLEESLFRSIIMSKVGQRAGCWFEFSLIWNLLAELFSWIAQISNAQNFYVLKICLNLFEISREIWTFLIQSQNLFQTLSLRSSAMCVYSTLSYHKYEYTSMAPLHRVHGWNKFWDRFNSFQIKIKFSNYKTGFEIWNKFKWIFKT